MKKTTKIVAAVTLALIAGGASAAIVAPTTAGGLGSVLFSLEDNNATSTNYKHSFVLDLALGNAGLNYSSFVNGTQGANGTLSWDLATIPEFSGFASDTADLNWSVVGGSQRTGVSGSANNIGTGVSGYNAVAPWGALSTAQDATNFKLVGNTAISGQLASTGNIGNWYSFNVSNSSATDVAPLDAVTSQYETILPDVGTLGQGSTSSGALNTLGVGTDNFYWITNNATAAISPATTNVTQLLGTFSLSANNVLTFQSANIAAVPLPGAVWLFFSALMGVLGISKRKKSFLAAA